jgi:hypothetical protein
MTARSLDDPIERIEDLTLIERGSMIDFFNVS